MLTAADLANINLDELPAVTLISPHNQRRKAYRLKIAEGSVPNSGHGRRARVGTLQDGLNLYRDYLDIQENEQYWSIRQVKIHLENVYFAYEAGLINEETYSCWNSAGFNVFFRRRGGEAPSIEDSSSRVQAGCINLLHSVHSSHFSVVFASNTGAQQTTGTDLSLEL